MQNAQSRNETCRPLARIAINSPAPTPVHSMSLIFGRKSLGGSLIGGLPETQEMLDYCAEHNIVSDIEMIRMDQINEAYERMLKGDGAW